MGYKFLLGAHKADQILLIPLYNLKNSAMYFMKKAAWLLLAGPMIFACDDNEVDVGPTPPPSGPDFETVFFEADLDMEKVAGYPVEYDPMLLLSVSYKGAGSSNLMPALSLEATHTEEVVSDSYQFSITEGHFIMKGNDDNLIFGNYSGTGVQNTERFEVTWNVRIDGGSGKFEGAQGKLQVVISDPHDSRSNLNQSLVARISGSIGLPSSTRF